MMLQFSGFLGLGFGVYRVHRANPSHEDIPRTPNLRHPSYALHAAKGMASGSRAERLEAAGLSSTLGPAMVLGLI